MQAMPRLALVPARRRPLALLKNRVPPTATPPVQARGPRQGPSRAA